MQSIIKRIIDHQLSDFKGMQATGRMVLSDELMNEVIDWGLQSIQPTGNTRSSNTKDTEMKIDPVQIISWLSIDRLAYSTEVGKTVVDFEVKL